MPLLGRLSAINRALIYEVGDLSREEATTYLTDKGVTKADAEEVVNCVGERLVDLQSSLNLLVKDGTLKGNEICKAITRVFFQEF